MLVLVARLRCHVTLQLCSSFWITERLLIFTRRTRQTSPQPALLSSQTQTALTCQHFWLITEIQGAVTIELISLIRETCLAGVKNCVTMQISA